MPESKLGAVKGSCLSVKDVLEGTILTVLVIAPNLREKENLYACVLSPQSGPFGDRQLPAQTTQRHQVQ